MCGIAGVLFQDGASRDVLEARLTSMAEPLAHRGPDDEGRWTDAESGLGFAFRRLAIIDLSSAGHQPMVSASGRYVMVFNGEVYNHRELGAELGKRGHTFRGHSDTEVMLAAMEEWGVRNALDRFRGMFAFAVFDRERRELLLARDRMGIKPLYLWRHGGRLAFASELRSILRLPEVERCLDMAAVNEFLRFLYVPAPGSLVRDVRKVLPGHLVTISVDTGEERDEAWWSLEDAVARGRREPFRGSPQDAVAALGDLLEESVRLRLRSDVPVGAFLSGGIDSSLVVACMSRLSANPIRTFTIGFEQEGFDESTFASRVAGALGTDHTSVPVSAPDLLGVVERLHSVGDEPVADPSLIPTWLVSRVARRSVVVSLSGDGGDELFGGYNRYLQGRRAIRAAATIPAPLRGPVGSLGMVGARALRAMDPGAPRGQHGVGERIEKLARLIAARSDEDRYLRLLSPGLDAPATDLHAARWSGDRTLLTSMLLTDQRSYLPDDLLAKVDRASMAVSLEARVPLLDHRIVEFSWTLPDDLKIRRGTTKWLLRELLAREIPRELFERPKMGFTVPIADWLRGPLHEWAADLLTPEALHRTGAVDPAPLRDARDRFGKGEDYPALGIWAAAVLQGWCLENRLSRC